MKKKMGLGTRDQGLGIVVSNLSMKQQAKLSNKNSCPLSPVPCPFLLLIISLLFAICSCTFDYGETEQTESSMPDLIMQNVEYIRIRSAEPQAKFFAQRAERYEKQNLMRLEKFSFEQYGERGEEVKVFGSAGHARINTDSSDIFMNQGVKIEVISEDITLETYQLEWQDEPRLLSTGDMHVVSISKENGTRFGGIGLTADARKRTWGFSDAVSGTFVHEDDEEEEFELEIAEEEIELETAGEDFV